MSEEQIAGKFILLIQIIYYSTQKSIVTLLYLYWKPLILLPNKTEKHAYKNTKVKKVASGFMLSLYKSDLLCISHFLQFPLYIDYEMANHDNQYIKFMV